MLQIILFHLKLHQRVNSPQAFPIWCWFLNPLVTATQRTIRIQLISGMYMWLWFLFDVCTTFTLGKQPSAAACLINENVADIVAWLATIAAAVATTNTGQYMVSAELWNMIICQTVKCKTIVVRQISRSGVQFAEHYEFSSIIIINTSAGHLAWSFAD